MAIVYREITEKADLFECLKLQQKIFGLNDLQVIPMLILDALGNNPSRSGLIVGAYDSEINKLIGFNINLCTTKPDTMFIIASGLLPKYQNSRSGLLLFENISNIADSIGFKKLEFFFDPLKHNLGRLYINYFHLKGVRLVYNAFPEFENSHRIFGVGDIIPKGGHPPHGDIDIKTTPFLTKYQNNYDSRNYLLKIPEETEDTSLFFQMLDRLINKENYIMENCITIKTDGKRQSYYCLAKSDVNHYYSSIAQQYCSDY